MDGVAAMGSKLNGRNVLLGVTGGIAAYKAVDLASKMTAAGANVYTVMTKSATKLIRPKSFEAITHLPVFTKMWTAPRDFKIAHIDLARQTDLVVVAPATANIIAKAAHGICDDLLSTTLCACWNKPVLIAPAMNDNMWKNPAVQKNVETIKQNGFNIIGPEIGRLACGTDAIGRMAEPQDIVNELEKMTG